jgi:cupin fold WbuC family metalloprotein
MSNVLAVDNAMIDGLLAQATTAPRLRKNLNFHECETHPCQRLLNAIVPGSYVRPHRHVLENKEEFMMIVRGCLGVILYDAQGNVTGKMKLDEHGPVRAVSIPTGVYHTAVALKPTVIFEAKGGPYAPHLPEELAPFAPAEGSPDAQPYLLQMEALLADA